MFNKSLIFKLIISLVLVALFYNTNNQVYSQEAKKGFLDLSKWNFKQNGYTNLDGEWEFYWMQIIDSSNINKSEITGYFEIPGLWNNKIIDSVKVNGNGYATFRLKVKLNNLKPVAFKIGRVETAYKLIINNKLVKEIGKVGKSSDKMQAAWLPSIINYLPDTTLLEIIMQVSNFKHRKGGISSSILIGKPNQIFKEEERMIGFDLFLLGVLLIMALYHFALYVLRRSEVSTFYFGMVCLLTSMHLISNGQFLLAKMYPDISWELLVKINFIGNYLRVPMFALFLGSLFKKEISKKFNYVFTGLIGLLVLSVVFTPARIYSHTLNAFAILSLIAIVYLITGLFKATFRNQREALFSIAGTFILLLTAINDILYDNLIIKTMYLVPFGIFIFIFFQSFMLSFRSSKAFNYVENLTKRLISLDKIKDQFLANTGYDLHKPLQIMAENVNAKKGYLIIPRNDKWIVAVSFPLSKNADDKQIELIGGNTKNPYLSDIIIRYVIQTKQNVISENASEDSRFSNDPYCSKTKPGSLLCLPLIYRDDLKGILYFENPKSGIFTKERLKIADLLTSQVAMLIDNASIYWQLENMNKNLEIKVKERTSEIEQQKEEILTINEELQQQKEQLIEAFDEIQIKNRDITDSINYAKRIQNAILPPEEYMKSIVPDSFVFYQPRDILSGDFYWMEKYTFPTGSQLLADSKPEFIIAAAVDCTGHGVPGALISIMGNNLLNNIINEFKYTRPGDILNIMQKGVQKYLHQDGERTSTRDGMDIALISYEKSRQMLQFAGAKNPLYLIRNNELQIIKGDRHSVGGVIKRIIKEFTNHEIKIEKGDVIYLFSDGFADQFGGPKNWKFTYKSFKELLLEIHQLEMEKQKELLVDTFSKWKGKGKQVDDVLVMGMKFN
ncbi:MAG: SpoIIE family protein phosphatase [Chlorobi bacterium]|nr:SpoIIE family protein phosphatase [Chlorobiota bacterium]